MINATDITATTVTREITIEENGLKTIIANFTKSFSTENPMGSINTNIFNREKYEANKDAILSSFDEFKGIVLDETI